MKFTKQLQSEATPEWRNKYINYDVLKDEIYNFSNLAPPIENLQARESYFASCDETFLEICKEELETVGTFYFEQINHAIGRQLELTQELVAAVRRRPLNSNKSTGAEVYPGPIARKTTVVHFDGADIDNNASDMHAWLKHHPNVHNNFRLAFAELYLQLILIQNYQELNFTGFYKILKKHDKVFGTTRGLEWYEKYVCPSEWVQDGRIGGLMAEIKNLCINVLEGGDRTAAKEKLRVPPLSEKTSIFVTFRLGLYLGALIILLVILGLCIGSRKIQNEPPWIAVRLFRGFSIIFANIFLVGINHYGWHRYGVNSVLIFRLNPRSHLTFQHLLEIASCFALVWVLCTLGYFFSGTFHIPRLVWPLILFCCFWGWLFNPFKMGYHEARRWMLKKFYILATPLCHSVLFADFWLADQANSLVTVFSDMEYFGCFYIMEVDWAGGLVPRNRNNSENGTMWSIDYQTGADQCNSLIYGIRPVIAVIPAAMRFFQCIQRYIETKEKHPHLTNAGKYSTTFFVVLFGSLKSWYTSSQKIDSNSTHDVFFWLWVLSYCVSTGYTYSWDIRMDWGLCRNLRPGSKNWLLRNQLVYPHKSFYYFAIVADLFLRLAWTMNISMGNFWYFHQSEILVYTTAMLECFRRFMWNFLRLENEHINNCGHFRAVRDISVKLMPRRARNNQTVRSRSGSVSGVLKNAFKTINSSKTSKTSLSNDDGKSSKSLETLAKFGLAPFGLSLESLKEICRANELCETVPNSLNVTSLESDTNIRNRKLNFRNSNSDGGALRKSDSIHYSLPNIAGDGPASDSDFARSSGSAAAENHSASADGLDYSGYP